MFITKSNMSVQVEIFVQPPTLGWRDQPLFPTVVAAVPVSVKPPTEGSKDQPLSPTGVAGVPVNVSTSDDLTATATLLDSNGNPLLDSDGNPREWLEGGGFVNHVHIPADQLPKAKGGRRQWQRRFLVQQLSLGCLSVRQPRC